MLTPPPSFAPLLSFRRSMTTAQVSTALRPFYFLVHPDLFGLFPKERAVNEDSLKALRAHLDAMVDGRAPQMGRANSSGSVGGRQKPLKFFLKPQSSRVRDRHALKSISLKLPSSSSHSTGVRQAVLSVLNKAELPTSYVDSLASSPRDPSSSSSSTRPRSKFDLHFDGDEDKVDLGWQSTDLRHPLPKWLAANVDTARANLAKHEPYRLQTQRLQDGLCYEFGISEILWDCGWETAHRRGSLASFRFLLESHPDVRAIVRDRRVVFGRFSGLSLDGEIVLYSGEVRYNWLNVIKRAPEAEKVLEIIPYVERTLSRLLFDVQISRRKFQPITQVEDYRGRLRKLVTTILDYKSRGGRDAFPTWWPDSLSQFHLCVEAEASPNMMTSDGKFIVASTASVASIVELISDNMKEASSIMSKSAEYALEEERLAARCVKELGLIQIERDDSLASREMAECCTRLLQSAASVRHLTHGNHLVVTKYYAVTRDGLICVPWNWKED